MKRFVSIFFIALSLSLTAKEKNANKKELGKLWDKYEESKMQDLPETSVRILEKIKEKAVKEQCHKGKGKPQALEEEKRQNPTK